jgi:hypothetical protein
MFQALSFSLKINFDKCLLHEYKLDSLSKKLFRTAFSKIEIISYFAKLVLDIRFASMLFDAPHFANLLATSL